MPGLELLQQLEHVEVPLESIFLDPNNPRFFRGARAVSRSRITEPGVQDRVIQRLVDEFRVMTLKASIEQNGYMPIDAIVVQQLDEEAWVVLEGNRRVAAMKLIRQDSDDGVEVAPEVLGSIDEIDAVLYTGNDPQAAWLFQGLRHISGALDWPPYQKGVFIHRRFDEEPGLTAAQLGTELGKSAYQINVWHRANLAFEATRHLEDFGGELDPDEHFGYFTELHTRRAPELRRWLEWSAGEESFENVDNMLEFLSWFCPWEEDDIGTVPTRRITQPQVKEVSRLVGHLEFDSFRAGEDLTRCLARLTDDDRGGDYLVSLQRLKSVLSRPPIDQITGVEELKEQVLEVLEQIRDAVGRVERAIE